MLEIGVYFVFINLLGFFIMYADKQKAKKQTYRIPEATLWNVAFLGGACGTTIGMKVWRHKTQKLGFRIGFPMIAIAQIILIIVIYHTFKTPSI